jgi:hypothetical protein
VNSLTVFGLFAVTAMVVCYALENRSHWFVLGFAFSCVLGSIYGFLQGGVAFRISGRRLVCDSDPEVVVSMARNRRQTPLSSTALPLTQPHPRPYHYHSRSRTP